MSMLSWLRPENRQRLLYGGGVFIVVALVTLGIFASNGWFPHTDPLTGKRTGWFGRSESTLAGSPPVLGGVAPASGDGVVSGGTLNAPPPEATPQLSKEYIYAGSRLLAVEDKNANAAPPADLAVWRPSNGTWYVNNGTTWVQQGWGLNGDVPVPGDYDGDGKTDFSVFRPTDVQWYLIHSSTGNIVIYPYGQSGDKVAQADYDGDGRTDSAIYRPPTGGATYGVWHIQATTAGYYTQTWGIAGDIPASADYDGDGKADIAVWRNSESKFYSISSANQSINPVPMTGVSLGQCDELNCVTSGDYDGDGRADYAVFDPAATPYAKWHIRQSSTGNIVTDQFGLPGDRAVQNDYDADGKVDLAVWRDSNGTWFIRQSGSGNSLRQVQWGMSGDIPVPAYYRR